jgi:hypothetical protein
VRAASVVVADRALDFRLRMGNRRENRRDSENGPLAVEGTSEYEEAAVSSLRAEPVEREAEGEGCNAGEVMAEVGDEGAVV